MPNLHEQAKSVFDQALEIEAETERRRFLEQRYQGQPDLRQPVEELLKAYQDAGSFLERPPFGLLETESESGTSLGDEIGPYKILQQLGEGGMGVVFLAERQQPVKQRVALKIIKMGMDSNKFIARFEAERQALAMMDHPNIAKVLDAGCSDNGRPYFVMELVKGVPICDFCDENRLTTRERLILFTQVCEAVNHAHQKGIIHRDIKPSNVLVAQYDDRPVPKVIDFGVAKATNQQLTDKTLFTEVGSILGTLEYMSPEQAVLNQLDVDTRTDIYSLGVLLYELLTGETPLDRHRLRAVQILETLRMIREDEPIRPSTRVSSLGDRLTSRAAYRGTKPESLASQMRGDLDWIVMKALSKERSRRYDTASRFAEDIQRHLNDELVEARPPSIWYQLQKFYQRNRALSLSVSTIGVVLIVAVAVFAFMNYRLRQANQQQVDLTMKQAVIGALTSDQSLVDNALQFLKENDAPQADILLIESLVKLNEGDFDGAFSKAEESQQDLESRFQDSDRIGAKSVMAASSMWSPSTWPNSDRKDVIDAEVENDLEALLQAYALAVLAPQRSLQILEEHPNLQSTSVGTFVAGQAEYMNAVDKGDQAAFLKSVQKIEVTLPMMRRSDNALMMRVLTLTIAMNQAKKLGDREAFERYRDEAQPLIPELAESDIAPWSVWEFALLVGAPDEALKACQQTNELEHCDFFITDCLLQGDYFEANDRFDAIMNGRELTTDTMKIVKAHVVRGLQGGDVKAKELLESIGESESAWRSRIVLFTHCLVCDRQELESLASKVADRFRHERYSDLALWREADYIRYLAGGIDRKQLLELCRHGQYPLSMAYISIAFKSLARGDLESAREFFKKTVDTETYGSSDYALALGYHHRMQADPSWPHWLPDRKTTD